MSRVVGKAPTAPAFLRPIGLLRPDAKAVAGAIKSRLLPFALARLQDIPQYAYLPGRDILDCLARVHGRLEAARSRLDNVGRGVFDRRRRLELGRGQDLLVGLFLSIDLSKAGVREGRSCTDRSCYEVSGCAGGTGRGCAFASLYV
jgi:hypothetical protein